MRPLLIWICVATLSGLGGAGAAAPPFSPQISEATEVAPLEVTANPRSFLSPSKEPAPGPAIWKASKGKGAVWVFGSPPLMARDLAWDRTTIEGVIREAPTMGGGFWAPLPGLMNARFKGPLFRELDGALQARLRGAAEKLGLQPSLLTPTVRVWVVEAAVGQRLIERNNVLVNSRTRPFLIFGEEKQYFDLVSAIRADTVNPFRAKLSSARNSPMGALSAYATADRPETQSDKITAAEHGACINYYLDLLESDEIAKANEAWATGDLSRSALRFGCNYEYLAKHRGALLATFRAIAAETVAEGRKLVIWMPIDVVLAEGGMLQSLRADGFTVARL